ncbi:MAG TPA: hypothetical protein VMI06_02280 [Terriglobia bacterium]|nr:hypothetical protein [Terriglobia bacterium]
MIPLSRGLWFDRALTNDRSSLPPKYELPVYLAPSSGEPNTSVRWPGWDGWYFFMVPNSGDLAVRMVRASIMTGLYGLAGVDDYSKLPPGLSAFDAVEHLMLTPAELITPAGAKKVNDLSHHYMPKRFALSIRRDVLDVAILGKDSRNDGAVRQYGRIQGSWPHYQFAFLNPDADISISLECAARHIIWWADVPGVFTYFAAFGDFKGSITYGRGSTRGDRDQEKSYALEGRGSFEHGYARKPFNFDALWSPVRAVEAVVPSFKAISYQYELFLGGDDLHGGFMLARGFGMNFRNLGGLYVNGSYIRIKGVKIDYLKAEDEHVPTASRSSVTFHREWKVRAVTTDGLLEYTGRREWPPPGVSSNMIYYNFSFSGTFGGKSISGSGYGEYLSL